MDSLYIAKMFAIAISLLILIYGFMERDTPAKVFGLSLLALTLINL